VLVHPYTARRTLILLLLALLLAACGAAPPSGQPWAASQDLPSPPQYLRLDSLLGVPLQSTVSPGVPVTVDPEQPFYSTTLNIVPGPEVVAAEGGSIAWVPANQVVRATFGFTNGTPNQRRLTVLCMLDYAQVPCRPDAPVLSLDVPSGAAVTAPVEVAGLGVGEHRVTALAFDYLPATPYITDVPERIGELVVRSGDFFWSWSIVLYAGGYTPPAPAFTDWPAVPDNPNSQGNLHFTTATGAVASALQDAPAPNLIPNSNFQGELLRVRPGAPCASPWSAATASKPPPTKSRRSTVSPPTATPSATW
jgi:hypothetical protein